MNRPTSIATTYIATITPAAVGYWVAVSVEGMEELQPPWRLTHAGARRCARRRLKARYRADERDKRREVIR